MDSIKSENDTEDLEKYQSLGISPIIFRKHLRSLNLKPDPEPEFELPLPGKRPPSKRIRRLKQISAEDPTTEIDRIKAYSLIDIPWKDRILGTRLSSDHVFPEHDDTHIKNILAFFNRGRKTLLDAFTFEGNNILALGYLNTVRIYAYVSGKYLEIKRMPGRKIHVAPNLITSIHFNNSKLYVAYLWGNRDRLTNCRKPYVERRDISGNLEQTLFLDQPVRSIQSDRTFTYMITESNHIRVFGRYHNISPYCINLNHLNPILAFRFYKLNTLKKSEFLVLIVTSKEVFLSKYDFFDTKILQCYHFNDPLISFAEDRSPGHCLPRRMIFHRKKTSDGRSMQLSRLEVGSLSCPTDSMLKYDYSQDALEFQFNIIQMHYQREELTLFTNSEGKYQIRSYEMPMDLTKTKLQWSLTADDVDPDHNLIVRSDHIILVKNGNEIKIINKPNAN